MASEPRVTTLRGGRKRARDRPFGEKILRKCGRTALAVNVKESLDSGQAWIAGTGDGDSHRPVARAAGVQGQMNTGFMNKFLEVRGIVAVVGCLLATVVSWSVLVGVAHAATLTAPTISGTTQEGQTLTAIPGTPVPTTDTLGTPTYNGWSAEPTAPPQPDRPRPSR